MRRLSATAALFSVAAIACGGETPARAIYALAHDLEHEVVDGTCERLFPSTLLPVRIAAALRISNAGESPVSDWDRERARCTREFGRRGEFDSLEFHEPLVRSVKRVWIAEQDEISAAALARVSLDGDPPETIPLVEFRGKWRIVSVVR
jgi:hypothetical protein